MSVNASASTLGGAWGSTYAYDGFGNLTSKTPTAGSAPQLSLTPDPLTNRTTATPGHYDDTGNLISQFGQFNAGYDVANRMVTYTPTTGGGESYAYDPDNLRVWKMTTGPQEYFYCYGAQGERLGSFKLAASVTAVQRSLYFGQRLVTNIVPGTTTQYTGRFRDRLGSARDAPTYSGYYPYGEEHVSAMLNDTDRFATYFRDTISGLDYARNRYYSSALGRFMSADPYRASGGPADPGSWNRYAYVKGDPVNFNDPDGTYARPLDSACHLDDFGFVVCTPLDDLSLQYLRKTDPGRFTSFVGGGSGEQGRDVVRAVNDLHHSAALDLAFAGIRAAFMNSHNSDCANWFNAALQTSANRGYGSLDSFIATTATFSGAGSFVGGHANALANSPLTPGTLIAVNTNGAFFNRLPAGQALAPSDDFQAQFNAINGGSDQARVFILLHELAHLLGMIRSNDGGSDAKSEANQRFNNDSIWRNCSGTIGSFSDRPH